MNNFDLELTIHFAAPGHAGDPVYLIGSLNNWQEQGMYLGDIPEGQNELTVQLTGVREGLLEFQLSRRGWSAISCRIDGSPADPFTFDIQANARLAVTVAAWSDDFQVATTAEQVHCLSEAFFFPELNAYRKVWIYLPKSYAYTATKRYPVLYMHDGQHLFDDVAALAHKGSVSWQVDQAVNASKREAIVVAIAHGGEEADRLHDYVVEPVSGMPEPAGMQYLADLVTTLKPYVDRHYRTLVERENTAIAGASLGGLLSLYAGLLYPECFSCMGVFSPSLWLDKGQVATCATALNAAERKLQPGQHYYLYGGGIENRKIKKLAPIEMDEAVRHIAGVLAQTLKANVAIAINPVGKHGLSYWQQAFPEFYEWWWEQMDLNTELIAEPAEK